MRLGDSTPGERHSLAENRCSPAKSLPGLIPGLSRS